MGVKGLSTYAAYRASELATQLTLDCSSANAEAAAAAGPSQARTLHDIAEIAPKGKTLVVDGLAFLFYVALKPLDFVKVDYASYVQDVQRHIEAWRRAGLFPIFIWDGPFLPAKLDKMLARRSATAGAQTAFMRSSPTSRASWAFQLESGLVPPLAIYATLDALARTSPPTPCFFAPTEADSAVAELAEQTGGYALSLDSDFFILCARGNGAAYVPLDTVEYICEVAPPVAAEAEAAPAEDAADDGFEAVTSRKRGGKAAAKKLPAATKGATVEIRSTPPKDLSLLTSIRFQSYSSRALANHLELPKTLLPLFAALVGNDYTPDLQNRVLFRNTQNAIERVKAAAGVLGKAWAQSLSGKGQTSKAAPVRRGLGRGIKETDSSSDTGTSATVTPRAGAAAASTAAQLQDPVRALVSACVEGALSGAEASVRSNAYLTSGEREDIVDGIVESAATYSLLTHSGAPHLLSPAASFFAEAVPEGAHAAAVEAYRAAYQRGDLREGLVDAVAQRVFLTRNAPEDPDFKSTQAEAGRELRCWIWAVLFGAWGMEWARESVEEPMEEEEESEDEEMTPAQAGRNAKYKEGESPDDVISVHTESSESADEMEDEEDDDDVDVPGYMGESIGTLRTGPGSVIDFGASAALRVKPPPLVLEYLRKGDKMVGDSIRIELLPTLLGQAASEGEALPAALADLLGQYTASASAIRAEDDAEPAASATDAAPLPPSLLPFATRQEIWLFAQASCTDLVRALPRQLQPLAAVLRHVIKSDAARLGARTARYAWSRVELQAAVRAGCVALRSHRALSVAARPAGIEAVQPSVRAIHASSTVQLLLETSTLLAQALLLYEPEEGVESLPPPHALHDGLVFQAYLAGIQGPSEKGEEQVLQAVLQGNEELLAVDLEAQRKEKKAKRKNKDTPAPVQAKLGKPSNAFAALLGETEL